MVRSALIVTSLLLLALPGAGPPSLRAVEGAEGDRRPYWAFRPLRRPDPPRIERSGWARSPIDRFVLARLEAAGLEPSPPADRRTLIRRLSYDLTGLPPEPAEVDAFLADPAPDAYERLVDRLLASPSHGERWGRHWLDVARYADTKDLVLVLGRDAIRPYAYTYRDYVIRALNEDIPYDRFVEEQLAADRIEPPVELWRLAAMGFLTLGRLFDNNPHDIYDDQIDTVTRGLLGLAVSCARCHDHKYDPIPQEDYYSLYGIFASSVRPLELPRIDERDTPAARAFEDKASALREKLRRHIDEQYELLTRTARERVGDYLAVVATREPDPLETAVFFMSLSPDQLRPQIIARWRRFLEGRSRPDDPVFGPWHDLMALPEEELPLRAPEILSRWLATARGTAAGELNPLVADKLTGAEIRSRGDIARLWGEVLRAADASRSSSEATSDERPRAFDQLLSILDARDGPLWFSRRNTYLYMSRVPRNEYHSMLLELDKLAVADAAAPPRAMVLVDSEELCDPRVFIRGDPSQPGKRVPRRFLAALSGERRPAFADSSGRLDLARAITASDNPLTSRVIANRVWMHHFGEPLVGTPSDFGTRSEPPTHPGLLDHLALTLVEEGWSLKALHRRIVLSKAYRQSSRDRPACRAVDPENRLLWRAHRRRLELEPMRDTLLALSGRLDRTLYGRPVDVAGDPSNRRRTVYGLVDRQQLPPLFRSFDFASPDQCVGRRPRTTVPQQALFTMNSPFVIEQARALAARPEVAGENEPRSRVVALHRIVFQREPSAEEVERALRFLEDAEAARAAGDPSRLGAWEQYAQALLMSNEVLFLD